jgi:methylmalonyl-CoA epimerase
MIRKIDHIGFAVHSIEEARKFYEKVLGLTCERIEEVPSQKVRTAFFTAGETHIELLEPTDPSSPVAGFLEKRGEGIHHIGYLSDNIEGQLALAEKNGCTLINAAPVEGAGKKRIAFLHPKSTHGVLTEICEKKETQR